MSRHYDERFIDIPECVFGNEKSERNGIGYSQIRGAPGYCITSDGSVLSYVGGEEPIEMKTYSNRHGHRYVDLAVEGKKQKKLVHRMMAEAFLENPNSLPLVRHLNDIPGDNRIDNLAWGTYTDNRADCVRNGHDYRLPVYCFETGVVYESGAEAAKQLDIQKSSISNCCKGKRSAAKGLHFCYESDRERSGGDDAWKNR